MAITTTELEERVALLEGEVSQLKKLMDAPRHPHKQ